jgi:DNA topoisomerase IA
MKARMSETAARPADYLHANRLAASPKQCKGAQFIAVFGESFPDAGIQEQSASAQEAHEAIRPVGDTEASGPGTGHVQLCLIWQRFCASQMEAAVYDTLQ